MNTTLAFKQAKPAIAVPQAGKAHLSAAPAKLSASSAETILAAFDLDQSFGPCVGLSRAARWERARALGLVACKSRSVARRVRSSRRLCGARQTCARPASTTG